MKKHLTLLTILLLAMNAVAQDIYSVGYYNVGPGTNAALYKNDKRLYIVHDGYQTTKATKVACNSEGDVYWLVNFYDYPSGTFSHSEIHLNNQIYSSTENHSEIHITDMYCLNDSIYCVGYQYDENSVAVATVWNGDDFTTHWVLGDGIHTSIVFDADVDENTNIPYFCGYVNDSIQKATVWKGQDLLYTYEGQDPYGWDMQYSYARHISIDNEQVYTMGYGNEWGLIWKENSIVYDGAYDGDFIDCLYAHQGDFYYTYYYPHGMYYAVYRNRSEILQLPLDNQTGVQRICGDSDDIYMIGTLQGHASIWKNFEVYLQLNNCNAIYDMAVSYASVNIEETNENDFAVYPNPANNVLFVQTVHAPSLPNQTYRITNLTGQTLLQGTITAESQQIDIEKLPAGMYFITVGETTRKFVVR